MSTFIEKKTNPCAENAFECKEGGKKDRPGVFWLILYYMYKGKWKQGHSNKLQRLCGVLFWQQCSLIGKSYFKPYSETKISYH